MFVIIMDMILCVCMFVYVCVRGGHRSPSGIPRFVKRSEFFFGAPVKAINRAGDRHEH